MASMRMAMIYEISNVYIINTMHAMMISRQAIDALTDLDSEGMTNVQSNKQTGRKRKQDLRGSLESNQDQKTIPVSSPESELKYQRKVKLKKQQDKHLSDDESDQSEQFEEEDSDFNWIPLALSNLHESQVQQDYLGRFEIECPNCGALYFECEKPSFNKCCKEGQLKLPLLRTPPEPIKMLFDYSDTDHSKEFHENIRFLNMVFSFTSIGEKGLDKRLSNMKGGVYVYRINNTVHHLIGSLLPIEGQSSKFSQFYIFDNTAERIEARRQVYPEISKDLIAKVEKCLQKENKLIHKYQQIGKKVINKPNFTIAIKDNIKNIDIRVYNQPASNQIAAIVPNTNQKGSRDIIVQRQDDKLQRIDHYHSACLPLSYVLLYPRGETGYSWSLTYLNKKKKFTKVTLRAFACYYLGYRKKNFNILHRSGKLFLQWLVDMYCAIEGEQLAWFKRNQKTIKADSYTNLVEAYRNAEHTQDIGNQIRL